MNILESLRVAIDAILINKGRSVLTMLGVVVGVGAVILLVSVGEGARGDVGDQLRGLGSNLIILVPGREDTRGGPRATREEKTKRGRRRRESVTPLRLDDMRALKKYCPSVAEVAAGMERQVEAKVGSRYRRVHCMAVSGAYGTVRDLAARKGAFITAAHASGGQRVAVIGKTIEDELFRGQEPMGNSLQVNGVKFRVIGLLEVKGATLGDDQDNRIIIPITAGTSVFGKRNPDYLMLNATDRTTIDRAMLEVKRVMKARHRGEEDFRVIDQAEILRMVNKVFGIMTAVVGGIGGISLVVGGIGIMNIMLVSVTERIREIGIRKAVGAREGDILRQFLIEATTLSVLGGGVGIAIGWCGSMALAALWEALPSRVTPLAVLVAFICSAAVGIFSGAYPAYRAAKLDPIEALRHE
ncbi:MAG: ABC transporter permease [Armatimonadota bacterium]|jgi:putative ABC transport system permease protein